MNKPLTKLERNRISAIWIYPDESIKRLMEAEAFWREAVKNFSPDGSPNDTSQHCQFCGEFTGTPHTPDCPWLLAQES